MNLSFSEYYALVFLACLILAVVAFIICYVIAVLCFPPSKELDTEDEKVYGAPECEHEWRFLGCAKDGTVFVKCYNCGRSEEI